MKKIKIKFKEEGKDKPTIKINEIVDKFDTFCKEAKKKFSISDDKFIQLIPELLKDKYSLINTQELYENFFKENLDKKEALTIEIAESPQQEEEKKEDPKPVEVPKLKMFLLCGEKNKKKVIKEYSTIDVIKENTKKILEEEGVKDPTLAPFITALKEGNFEFTTSINEVPSFKDVLTYNQLLIKLATIEEKNRKVEIKLKITDKVAAAPNPVANPVDQNNEQNAGKQAPVNKKPNESKKGELTSFLEQTLKKAYEALENDLKSNLSDNVLRKMKEEFEKNEKPAFQGKHGNIVRCNNCYNAIEEGPRFLCAECKQYNLCYKCERFQNHNKEHFLIKINPGGDEEEKRRERLYDSIIKNNQQVIQGKLDSPIPIKVELINNGDTDWKDCFLYPIGFGDNYTIADKILINPVKVGAENTTTIKLVPKKTGNLVSKWRMFNKAGIPFGDVLYVHLSIC